MQGRTDPQANKLAADMAKQAAQASQILDTARQELGAKQPQKLVR